MKIPIPSMGDFPSGRPNCGNCTQSRSFCPRTKSNKQQHNGMLYGWNGEVTGIIYRCPHYTGPYEFGKELELFTEKL